MNTAYWSRVKQSLLRTVCRSSTHDIQGAPQSNITVFSGFSGGRSALTKTGTASLFLPPQLVQTVRTVRTRLDPLAIEQTAIPREFHEVQSDLLSRIATQSSNTTAAVLAVDPDCSGAVAILQLSLDGASAMDMLKCADVAIYDMPVELVPTAKRFRKQADPSQVSSIVANVKENLPEGASIQAIVEKPIPGPLNGTYSVFNTGLGFGIWTGVLAAHRVDIDAVAARTWKLGLGLNGTGKEGSRAMALQIFPQAEHLLRRKKDHGRAEALLLLAWAAGIRASHSAVSSDVSKAEKAAPLEDSNSIPICAA